MRQAECVNQDARAFNAKLRKQVEAAVDKRIQDLSKLATIRNILDIPLPRIEGGPPIKPIPLQKKQVRFDKPQQTSEESPRGISDCDYQNIIDIIDDCGALMERTPKSFAALDEEFLRDHILTILGTHYDNATGETFRKKGKTDICVQGGSTSPTLLSARYGTVKRNSWTQSSSFSPAPHGVTPRFLLWFSINP